ncbi:MAG: hypothetical protein ACREIL_05195 [Nitrospiraceae bacterium]
MPMVSAAEWSPDALHPDHNQPNGGMMGGNMMSAPDDPDVMFTVNGKAFPLAWRRKEADVPAATQPAATQMARQRVS